MKALKKILGILSIAAIASCDNTNSGADNRTLDSLRVTQGQKAATAFETAKDSTEAAKLTRDDFYKDIPLVEDSIAKAFNTESVRIEISTEPALNGEQATVLAIDSTGQTSVFHGATLVQQ